jgi:hypothetical protein
VPVPKGKPANLPQDLFTASKGSVQDEPPLQRPAVAARETSERPLQRPLNEDSSIAFPDIAAAIAVDISGSTMGRILEQEKQAITKLCRCLSAKAQQRARVIPWNHEVQQVIGLEDLVHLSSGGGTNPTHLTTFRPSQYILRNCSTWFLLTDGEINESYVRKFAAGISNNEIHGTACIIILFGYMPSRPVDCNISVGLSVFAASPDCLFLFHDVDSSKVFILQTKGLFKTLLPKGCETIILDNATTWNNLPPISYRQLSKLRIPVLKKLKPNKLRLQSRSEVDLDDIYHNRVSESVASEILDNDDNLKSVLLVAQLRGQTQHVKRWVSKQKTARGNPLHATRPDLEQKAELNMRELLAILQAGGPPESHSAKQGALRAAHRHNWSAFIISIKKEEKQVSRRETIVKDALDRIEQNKHDHSEGRFAGSSISSVSCAYDDIFLSTTPPMLNISVRGHRSVGLSFRSRRKSPIVADSPVLYIPGYREDTVLGLENIFRETCPLCGELDTPLALLLKNPPKGDTTPNFPTPNSRAGLAFPLAMGPFRETDIVSSTVCCHPCAHTLVRHRLSFDEEEFIDAIPLTGGAISGEFQPALIEAIDKALAWRFERSVVESVFFAAIYNTLNQLPESGASNTDLLDRALRWTASELSQNLFISPCLSSTFSGSTLRARKSDDNLTLPLPVALSQSIHKINEPLPELLRYPVGGFVVMILAIDDLELELGPQVREQAVFQRLLFHLTEQYYELLVSDKDAAIKSAQAIFMCIQSTRAAPAPAQAPADPENIPSPCPEFTIDALMKTNLLSLEDLDTFHSLGPLFAFVEEKCLWAVLAYLHFLVHATVIRVDSGPMECFDRVRNLAGLKDVFRQPEKVNDQFVAALWKGD